MRKFKVDSLYKNYAPYSFAAASAEKNDTTYHYSTINPHIQAVFGQRRGISCFCRQTPTKTVDIFKKIIILMVGKCLLLGGRTIKLSDTEWKIMLLLWENAPMTCRQIEDALKNETGWSRHTIISFLKRMAAKNYVRMEEAKPSRLYYPLLGENETMLSETKSFVKKLFRGNTGLMVSSLVDSGDISEEDIFSIMETLKQVKTAEEKNE